MQDQFRGKSSYANATHAFHKKSVCLSKFDPISFLSGMHTQCLKVMLTSRSDLAAKFMSGLDEPKVWPFNLTCHC